MSSEFNLDDIREILRSCREYEPGHHLRRPFMSAYQIAIRFAERFPNHPSVQRLPIGGLGTGENQSLSQRIARFLSNEIHKANGRLDIQGGFISHDLIKEFSFSDIIGNEVQVSTLSSEAGHSIFRLQ